MCQLAPNEDAGAAKLYIWSVLTSELEPWFLSRAPPLSLSLFFSLHLSPFTHLFLHISLPLMRVCVCLYAFPGIATSATSSARWTTNATRTPFTRVLQDTSQVSCFLLQNRRHITRYFLLIFRKILRRTRIGNGGYTRTCMHVHAHFHMPGLQTLL